MKQISIYMFAVLTAIFCLTSCEDEDENSINYGDKKNLITTLVGESVYLSGFKDLNQPIINNTDAVEHISGSTIFRYENLIFVTEGYYGDKIYKYLIDGEGNLIKKGHISMPSASRASEITFVNRTKAYVSLNGAGKVFVINPEKLEKIAEIDLSEYAIEDNNPDLGVSIIRDDKLYVSLNQNKSQISAHNVAQVAIIDIATNKVDKVISDNRVSAIGYFNHTEVFMDEKGHIYFYGNGMFGYQPDAGEGYLRIKKGESDWDKSYHLSIRDLNLPDVPGNKGMYAMGMKYVGNGDLYVNIQIPALGTNPPDFVNTRDYQPFRVNINTKSVKKINLPPSAGWSSWGIDKIDDKIVFALSTLKGNGLYTYDPETDETSETPIVKVVGMPIKLMNIK